MTEEPERQRRKRGKGVPREELDERYPSLKTLLSPEASQRSWVAVFKIRPDAMHSLLADFIKQVHATPGRIGQRPMPREEAVDFHSLVYGEEAEEPLTAVLPRLLAGHPDFKKLTQGEQAAKVLMSRTQFQRMLRGDYQPDVNELRLIAGALGKPPIFFMEYRKAMAIAAFVNMIDERPGYASTLYRHYLEVRMGETA